MRIQIFILLCIIQRGSNQACSDVDRLNGANIALRRRTAQSTTYSKDGVFYTPNLAVDGNDMTDWSRGSCSSTDASQSEPAWWSVDLGEERILKKVIIFNRADELGRLKGASVIGYAANGTHIVLSSSLQDVQMIQIDVTISNPIRNVTILLPAKTSENIVNICEVQVFENLNIARGKSTWQSSVYSTDSKIYGSELAVDGDESGVFGHGSCTATDPWKDANRPIRENASWSVDLGREYLISYIKVINRKDDDNSHVTRRLGYFTIMATTDISGSIILYYETRDDPGEEISIPLYANITVPVKVISLSIPRYGITADNILKENVLTICEFEAYRAIACPIYRLENGNIQVRTLGDNKKNYTYCAALTLTCDEGYHFNFTEDQSLTTTCQSNGAWTTLAQCEVITCNMPKLNQTIGTYTCTKLLGGACAYHSILTIQCNMGYRLSGSNSIQCIDTDRWSGSIVCNEITCNIPELNRTMGTYTCTKHVGRACAYYSILTIHCNTGYSLSGFNTSQCIGTDVWNRDIGVCKDIDECTQHGRSSCSNKGTCKNTIGSFSCVCQAGYSGPLCAIIVRCMDTIGERHNGSLEYQSGIEGNLTYNSTVSIRCQEGYNLTGTDHVRCVAHNVWDRTLGNCSVVRCYDKIVQPSNGFLEYDLGIEGNLTYNSTVSIRCRVGYNLIGTDHVRCNAHSHWDGTLGNCSVVRCVDESLQRNNSILVYQSGIEGNLTYNATVSIGCQVGYKLTGLDLVRCNAHSLWNGTLGHCSVVRCVDESLQRNNSVLAYQSGIEGNLTYNATVYMGCKVGYTLTGKDHVRCNAHNLWNGTLGHCSVVRCMDESLQRNNSVLAYQSGIEGNFTYNATVYIGCQAGYTLTGTDHVRCNADSRWDGTLGNCSESLRDGEPESSVAGIAGGVTATIVAVILGVIIAYFLYRRRARGPNDRMADTTLNTIPSSSRGKGHNEEVILDTSIYAQPSKMNISPKRPEIDETKIEYMNSNDMSRDYYSFTPQKVTDKHSVRVDDLSSFFLSRKMEPGLYEEEYNKLPNGLTKSHDVALLPENKSKNRYKNMYPYDDTRVRLEIWDPNIENDYINACYINGFKTVRAYIAAQGPTKSILNDFWRMIWQTKCSKIVMLTNLIEEGKHKCEQYWPAEGSVEYGDIVIRLVQCETFSDFTIRTLELRKTGERKEDKNKALQVKQFHFTAWPDRGVPRFASSLVHFRHKIHTTKTRQNSEGPIVVHCSAGIGRTGTFLALDYLVDQAEEMGYINVVHCVENLRKQRVNLVQTLEQYIFVHEALVEALTCTTMAMSTSEFQETYRTLLERDSKTGKRKLDDAFEKLPMYISDPGEDVYENAKDMENRDKNRYSNILPDKNHCPYLNVYVKGRDSYINAVFLPAYKLNDIFVVTQTPLENTIVDFWRMVYQLEVSSIVMLNTLSEMKEEERYWTENEETLEILPFKITLESKTSDDICTNYTMLLKYHDERRRVRLSRATYWAEKKNVPKSPTAMLKQIDLIQRWQQETCNKPIVVHCMNGAERSGLFCVVAALLERTKIEQDVAVEQIIKQMRSRRPQVIPNVDQFKFCYDAVSAYLDQFDTYSNFAGL